jgi:hypothetical protein
MTLTMRPTSLGHGVYEDSVAAGASPSRSIGVALPYVLSWATLGILMVIGAERVPSALYRPVDGDWAKWNVEAILHFGKPFDLGPYSMLAGMGSMYFPNLPWLNPGALALGLPFDGQTTSIVSYVIYAAELAVSIIALARVIGFSWLMSTVAAQLYLYLLCPPFSEVFRIYDWYSLAPYYAHLQAALNGATAVLLVCGRLADWRANALLALAFFALFVSGLLSAPFTFVFATPAYVVICAAMILAKPRPRTEWAWKIAALALCLIFIFSSGLLDYYLGTMATAGRTPTAPVAWDRLLSAEFWLHLFRDHSLCSDSRLLLCINNRGGWLLIAALGGAILAIVTRRGDIRTAAAAFIAYIALVHLYAYAYQTISLGPLGVLSSHFLMLSAWSFTCMFAVVPFFQPFQLLRMRAAANAGSPLRKELVSWETLPSPPCCLSLRWVCSGSPTGASTTDPLSSLSVSRRLEHWFWSLRHFRLVAPKRCAQRSPPHPCIAGAGLRFSPHSPCWRWCICPWACTKGPRRFARRPSTTICAPTQQSTSERHSAALRPRSGWQTRRSKATLPRRN